MKNKTLKDDCHKDTSVEYGKYLNRVMSDRNHEEFIETIKYLDDNSVLEYFSFLSSFQGVESRYVDLTKKELLLRLNGNNELPTEENNVVMKVANNYSNTLNDLIKGMSEYIKRKLERIVKSDYANNKEKRDT